ncbi:MAG: hypothetical protein OCD76_06810 [Reichenbachiella sp.]
MNSIEEELWGKLKNFEIDEPDSAYTFSMRIAKENGWKISHALQAIEEYKKFLFLACTVDHPVTPSDQVDQVWHLHLIYTRSYWIDLCKHLLQREIHHGPTTGGSDSTVTFKNFYNETLNSYKKYFKKVAPEEFWPDSDKRFSDIHFRRINVKKHWIIKRP